MKKIISIGLAFLLSACGESGSSDPSTEPPPTGGIGGGNQIITETIDLGTTERFLLQSVDSAKFNSLSDLKAILNDSDEVYLLIQDDVVSFVTPNEGIGKHEIIITGGRSTLTYKFEYTSELPNIEAPDEYVNSVVDELGTELDSLDYAGINIDLNEAKAEFNALSTEQQQEVAQVLSAMFTETNAIQSNQLLKTVHPFNMANQQYGQCTESMKDFVKQNAKVLVVITYAGYGLTLGDPVIKTAAAIGIARGLYLLSKSESSLLENCLKIPAIQLVEEIFSTNTIPYLPLQSTESITTQQGWESLNISPDQTKTYKVEAEASLDNRAWDEILNARDVLRPFLNSIPDISLFSSIRDAISKFVNLDIEEYLNENAELSINYEMSDNISKYVKFAGTSNDSVTLTGEAYDIDDIEFIEARKILNGELYVTEERTGTENVYLINYAQNTKPQSPDGTFNARYGELFSIPFPVDLSYFVIYQEGVSDNGISIYQDEDGDYIYQYNCTENCPTVDKLKYHTHFEYEDGSSDISKNIGTITLNLSEGTQCRFNSNVDTSGNFPLDQTRYQVTNEYSNSSEILTYEIHTNWQGYRYGYLVKQEQLLTPGSEPLPYYDNNGQLQFKDQRDQSKFRTLQIYEYDIVEDNGCYYSMIKSEVLTVDNFEYVKGSYEILNIKDYSEKYGDLPYVSVKTGIWKEKEYGAYAVREYEVLETSLGNYVAAHKTDTTGYEYIMFSDNELNSESNLHLQKQYQVGNREIPVTLWTNDGEEKTDNSYQSVLVGSYQENFTEFDYKDQAYQTWINKPYLKHFAHNDLYEWQSMASSEETIYYRNGNIKSYAPTMYFNEDIGMSTAEGEYYTYWENGNLHTESLLTVKLVDHSSLQSLADGSFKRYHESGNLAFSTTKVIKSETINDWEGWTSVSSGTTTSYYDEISDDGSPLKDKQFTYKPIKKSNGEWIPLYDGYSYHYGDNDDGNYGLVARERWQIQGEESVLIEYCSYYAEAYCTQY